jgi:hypothetical protein
MRDDLNLRFERLNIKSNEHNKNCNHQDVAFFGDQFREKCRNCVVIGHNARDCKNEFLHNGGKNRGNQNSFRRNSSNGADYTYCRQPGHHKGNCFKLLNRSNHNSCNSSSKNKEGRLFNSDNVAFTSIARMENNFSMTFNSEASCHYCQSMEELTDFKDIDKLVKTGNGGAMFEKSILTCSV